MLTTQVMSEIMSIFMVTIMTLHGADMLWTTPNGQISTGECSGYTTEIKAAVSHSNACFWLPS